MADDPAGQLGEAGRAVVARAMADKQDKLSLHSRATLALLLHKVGETGKAKEIVTALEKQVVETAQTASWAEATPMYEPEVFGRSASFGVTIK